MGSPQPGLQEEKKTENKEGRHIREMKRKEKSLRQIAKELGVSPSYLSQVRHGKRPASHKVLSSRNTKMLSNLKESVKQEVKRTRNSTGGSGRSRTDDLGLMSPLLWPLSYAAT